VLVVLSCSADIFVIVLDKGLQVDCSPGCHVVSSFHFELQEDINGGDVSISIRVV
jgi:hypothetical protein